MGVAAEEAEISIGTIGRGCWEGCGSVPGPGGASVAITMALRIYWRKGGGRREGRRVVANLNK